MASYLFVRTDDHLVVGVRWSGFARTGVDAAGVPILTASANARLIVLLPPQHVAEETSPHDSEAPLVLAAGGTGGTVPGWRGFLSGGSRVAVRVQAGTQVGLSAEGVLARCGAAADDNSNRRVTHSTGTFRKPDWSFP